MAARSAALAWALARAAATAPPTRPHRSSSQLALSPRAWLVLMRAVLLPSAKLLPLRVRPLLALAPTEGNCPALLPATAAWAARRRATESAMFWLSMAACCCKWFRVASPYSVHQASDTAPPGCAGRHTPLAVAAAASL